MSGLNRRLEIGHLAICVGVDCGDVVVDGMLRRSDEKSVRFV